MVKAIIFDLGNTIIPFDFARSYERLRPLCGLEAAEIRARIRAAGIVVPFELGQIESEDFARRLTGALEVTLSFAEFQDVWGCIFERETLVPESLMEGLRANGYRLLVLSNTNDLHIRFVRERYPILRHFDHFVFSHEVKMMKPDPAIYAEAVRQAGCAAGECLFVDDLEENIEAAKRAGLDGVVFKKYEQLRGELLARGVKLDSV